MFIRFPRRLVVARGQGSCNRSTCALRNVGQWSQTEMLLLLTFPIILHLEVELETGSELGESTLLVQVGNLG